MQSNTITPVLPSNPFTRGRRSRHTSPNSRPRTFLRIQMRENHRVMPTALPTRKGASLAQAIKITREIKAQLGPQAVQELEKDPSKVAQMLEQAEQEAQKADDMIERIRAKKLAARAARTQMAA